MASEKLYRNTLSLKGKRDDPEEWLPLEERKRKQVQGTETVCEAGY